MSVTQTIKNKLYPLREKKLRLRAVFTKFRKMKKYQYLSDLTILTILIELLKETQRGVGKLEIYSAFKLVDKNDYIKEQKRQLLKTFLNNVKKDSVY